MADFRKLAITTLLANGKIDDDEVKALQKGLYQDGKIDKKEVEFLVDLRIQAQKKAKAKQAAVNPKFTSLFFKAIEATLLADGNIDTKGAKWLRTMLFANGKIDDDEKKFLTRVKKTATKVSSEFDKLYSECMTGK